MSLKYNIGKTEFRKQAKERREALEAEYLTSVATGHTTAQGMPHLYIMHIPTFGGRDVSSWPRAYNVVWGRVFAWLLESNVLMVSCTNSYLLPTGDAETALQRRHSKSVLRHHHISIPQWQDKMNPINDIGTGWQKVLSLCSLETGTLKYRAVLAYCVSDYQAKSMQHFAKGYIEWSLFTWGEGVFDANGPLPGYQE